MTGGTLQPLGTLTINGNLKDLSGLFDEFIGSSTNGVVDVNGNARLGSASALNIELASGFTPFFGETFILMDYFKLNGDFGNAPSSGFQMDGLNWTIDYDYGGHEIVLDAGSPVSPTATPEPGSLLLLVIGLAILAWQWQRKKSAVSI